MQGSRDAYPYLPLVGPQCCRLSPLLQRNAGLCNLFIRARSLGELGNPGAQAARQSGRQAVSRAPLRPPRPPGRLRPPSVGPDPTERRCRFRRAPRGWRRAARAPGAASTSPARAVPGGERQAERRARGPPASCEPGGGVGSWKGRRRLPRYEVGWRTVRGGRFPSPLCPVQPERTALPARSPRGNQVSRCVSSTWGCRLETAPEGQLSSRPCPQAALALAPFP